MEKNPTLPFEGRTNIADYVAYAAIIFCLLMMFFPIPGLIVDFKDTFMNQLWNGVLQFIFCFFGYLIVDNYRITDATVSSTELKAETNTEIENKLDQIKLAFPAFSKDNDALKNAYKRALINTVQTLDEVRWIWLAWTLFYFVNIFKNLYYKNWLTDSIGPFYYYFDTAETLASNIVCIFSLSLYFKLNTLRFNSKKTFEIMWLIIGLISAIHLILLQINTINPLEVNWAFQIIGSSLSGVALVLLFSRLCGRSIAPPAGYIFIFIIYAILQPLILLHYTEAMILRMPENRKIEEAEHIISNALNKYIGDINSNKIAQNDNDTKEKIKKDISWLNEPYAIGGTNESDPQNLGKTNRNKLYDAFYTSDFDIETFKTMLKLSPLSEFSQTAILQRLEPMRINLVSQRSIAKYATLRRWYLFFGKAWFLIYIGWLYKSGRILRYFMSHDRKKLEKEHSDFDENKKNLPGINLLNLS